MRASCCVMVLPPCARSSEREVVEDGPAEADRVDAGVQVEAMILDRDDRVLEIGRDLVERDVAPLLVERNQGRPPAS